LYKALKQLNKFQTHTHSVTHPTHRQANTPIH